LFILIELVVLGFSNHTFVAWNWLKQSPAGSFAYTGNSMMFLSDGRFCTQTTGGLYLWNAYTGSLNLSLTTYEYALEELSNDGLLVNSDWGYNINFWNLTTGLLVHRISTSVNHAYLKQVGLNCLASCDSNGVIYLWNLTDYTLIRNLTGPATKQYKMKSYNDTYLVTASYDGYLQVWNVITGQCLSTFNPFYGKINEFQQISDSTWAVSGAGGYILFLEMKANFEFRVVNKISLFNSWWPYDFCVTMQNMLVVSLCYFDFGLLTFYNLSNSLELVQYLNLSSTSGILRTSAFGKIKKKICCTFLRYKIITVIKIS
jgi:WD40 repeat protein